MVWLVDSAYRRGRGLELRCLLHVEDFHGVSRNFPWITWDETGRPYPDLAIDLQHTNLQFSRPCQLPQRDVFLTAWWTLFYTRWP